MHWARGVNIGIDVHDWDAPMAQLKTVAYWRINSLYYFTLMTVNSELSQDALESY